MKFVFTDKKVNLPNKVHAYAEKKVGKLDRYFKADAEAAIVFSVEKDRNQVEVTVRSGGTVYRVSESTSDMFASIDAAVSSIERQIRKNKARLEKRLRENAFERTVDSEEVSTFVPEETEEPIEILRTKRTMSMGSSASSGTKVEISSASTVRSKAFSRRRFSRRALFLRIWRSTEATAASMVANMSEVLSATRMIVLPERMVSSTLFRFFSTLKTIEVSASALK